MSNPLLLGAVLSAICCALPAQTFIVDAANGPGATFGELPVAVASVPEGSILLVRPGTYGHIEIDGKSLSILATAPGVVITDPFYAAISVSNLAAWQAVTVRGIAEQGTNVQARCLLRDCNGPVLIDDFTSQTGTGPYDVSAQAVRLERCLQVSLRNCHLRAHHALHSIASDVAVENCDLTGYDSFPTPNGSAYPGYGAWVEGGIVVFARCRVRGGNGPLSLPQSNPAPAMFLGSGATVRLCEDPSGSYTAGALPALPATGIVGNNGILVRDPSALVHGSNGGPATSGYGLGGPLTDVIRPLPSLRTVSARPGGVVSADVTTPIGELVILAVSLPGRISIVPGIDGNWRLDPASTVVTTLGVPAAGVPVAHSIAVPNEPTLIGARFVWQALAWSPAQGLRASNPSTYAL